MIFCIGNGESRQKIDLHFLKKYGTIYGSNALYRDFTPDILVTCDPMMLEEIIESGYSKENKVYTTEYGYGNVLEKVPKGHKVSLVPFKKIYPVNSGWTSIRLAYHFYPEEQIYMIGFDMFGDRKNIYDRTRNYPRGAGLWTKGRYKEKYDNNAYKDDPKVDMHLQAEKEFRCGEDERVGLFYLLKEEFCPGIRLTRVIDDNTKIENIDNITTEQFLEELKWQ